MITRDGNTNVVTVSRGGVDFLLDGADWERLQHLPWNGGVSKLGRPYLARQEGWPHRRNIQIYHDVLGVTPSRSRPVDHRNGDPRDNRRANLRQCSVSQNSCNAPPRPNKFKGVYTDKGKIVARIKVGDRLVWLGRFASPAEAAMAYDRAAERHFGDFAWLNHHNIMMPLALGGRTNA